jgi:hypothetical protein
MTTRIDIDKIVVDSEGRISPEAAVALIDEVQEYRRQMHVLSAEEATTVRRPADAAWAWPEVVGVMISDSLKVTGRLGLHAANGDPLAHAYALNFIETLYRNGYAVVRLRP